MKTTQLYPIKFYPIPKQRIWGGNNLKKTFSKAAFPDEPIGESWEISDIEGSVSIIANGPLKGVSLREAIERYREDFVGKICCESFGNRFPLLFKLIDAREKLSVQVHPDDISAPKFGSAFGKTEAWYVLSAENESEIVTGLVPNTDKHNFIETLNNGKLETILQSTPASFGDVFFIPAGRVHAIGSGIILAEIQQSSDITFRVFDYNRKDSEGKLRELHVEQALEVINWDALNSNKINKLNNSETLQKLIDCEYFKLNQRYVKEQTTLNYEQNDSFVVLMCIAGSCEIKDEHSFTEKLTQGESIFLPACLSRFTFNCENDCLFLEITL